VPRQDREAEAAVGRLTCQNVRHFNERSRLPYENIRHFNERNRLNENVPHFNKRSRLPYENIRHFNERNRLNENVRHFNKRSRLAYENVRHFSKRSRLTYENIRYFNEQTIKDRIIDTLQNFNSYINSAYRETDMKQPGKNIIWNQQQINKVPTETRTIQTQMWPTNCSALQPRQQAQLPAGRKRNHNYEFDKNGETGNGRSDIIELINLARDPLAWMQPSVHLQEKYSRHKQLYITTVHNTQSFGKHTPIFLSLPKEKFTKNSVGNRKHSETSPVRFKSQR
jgi:hypothetical protein